MSLTCCAVVCVVQERQERAEALSATIAASRPELAKYVKLLDMGMPEMHVRAKMAGDGLDPDLINSAKK